MRRLCWALAVAVLGQGVVCAPAVADDDDDFIPISTCNTSIEAPGKYKLTNDLLSCFDLSLLWFRNGITVYANDVTIDLNGHTISCAEPSPADGTWAVGVFVTSGDPPRSNIRVRNGTIENCGDGVFAAINHDSTFEKLTVRDGFYGISMVSGYDNRIRMNHVYGMQQFGILVNNNFGPGGGHQVMKNLIHDTGIVGINVWGITDSKIQCNRADGSGNTGISVGPGSTGVDVRNNVANDNAQAGIAMGGNHFGPFPGAPTPTGNRVMGNTALGNLYDLAEASVDLWDPNFAFSVLPDAVCSNTWKGNRYITELAPLDCIAPPRPIHDDHDDDGCAPDIDNFGDDDDD